MSCSTPRISVVIPTYNRPDQLASCLQALNAQDLAPTEFEVLVVDDGGRHSLNELVERARQAVSIHLVRQTNAGPATARNLGARRANGEYLAFTDDDCRPAANWLRVVLARLEAQPGALVGGLVVNALTGNVYSATSQMLVDYLYERYTNSAGLPLFFTSNNFALSKSLFLELGGFEPICRVSSEDREFCHRWQAAGRPSLFAPEAIVDHAHELSLWSFVRQHFAYGRGAVCFRTLLVASGQRPVKLEPLAFYRNLVLYPWQRGKDSRRWRCTSLMVLTQVANVAGFLFEALAGARGRRANIAACRSRQAHVLASDAMDDREPAARSERVASNHRAASETAPAPTT
jgi:glycosyltransferase involved in cell wall biosynthesis